MAIQFDFSKNIGFGFEVDNNINYYYGNFKFMEEEQEMSNFQLGDIFVVKNKISDFLDGEAIIVAAGYDETDFDINQSDKGVCVTFYSMCEDCEDLKVKEFTFDFNPYRKVEDVKYNVRNGIFVLQVAYAVGSNVEKDENL
jgi:hypothetical protein